MDNQQKTIAQQCKDGAENGTMTFPQIIGKLMEAGFENYTVDFRRQTAIYYMTNGDSVELKTHVSDVPVAAAFNQEAIHDAIREAQALIVGYTYQGFCAKVKTAGCAGYIVSFLGKRAVYFGRTAETHVEYFPGSK